MNFLEELKWRGMLHDITPGTEEQLEKEITTAYIGFDPTADSLHVGSFAQIMLLKRFQMAGHKPIALMGGATGMIGDPTGKSQERNLLNEDALARNLRGIEKQLSKFIDFTSFYKLRNLVDSYKPLKDELNEIKISCLDCFNNYTPSKKTTLISLLRKLPSWKIQRSIISHFEQESIEVEKAAELVNNYDWMKEFSFLEFIRDIGKHITVNYMMAKDSVKKRIGEESKQGMSFTEFSYQLVQGYDFLWLNEHKQCKLQMGGSDQWGNITTGTELIRRKNGGDAFALTIPLVTKADGGKFGKTESGNVWLDPERTSPYEFYQFWLNTSDEDAVKYIKIFTLLNKTEVDALIAEHEEAPHQRALQKKLAEEITVLVHSREDYEKAVEASQILFGKGSTESLAKVDEKTFLSVFKGVPQFSINMQELSAGINILDLLAEKTQVFPSKGELRRTIKGGGLSLNKNKIADPELTVDTGSLLNNKYLLVQKGKKNYFVITVN